MSVMEFLILGLATFRLSSLLASEPGPYAMFERIRHFVGVRRTEENVPYGTTELARGMICLWCNSVWVGFFWALAYLIWPGVVYVALPCAISASAILIDGIASLILGEDVAF